MTDTSKIEQVRDYHHKSRAETRLEGGAEPTIDVEPPEVTEPQGEPTMSDTKKTIVTSTPDVTKPGETTQTQTISTPDEIKVIETRVPVDGQPGDTTQTQTTTHTPAALENQLPMQKPTHLRGTEGDRGFKNWLGHK